MRTTAPLYLGPYIGRRVAHLRTVRRLALEDLASRAGVDARWLEWLEAGQVRDPAVSALCGLARVCCCAAADALHVTPQALLPERVPARRQEEANDRD